MDNPIKMDDLGVPLFLETPMSKVFFKTFWVNPSSFHVFTIGKVLIPDLYTMESSFSTSGCFFGRYSRGVDSRYSRGDAKIQHFASYFTPPAMRIPRHHQDASLTGQLGEGVLAGSSHDGRKW